VLCCLQCSARLLTCPQSPDDGRICALPRLKACVCNAAGTLNKPSLTMMGGVVRCVAVLCSVQDVNAYLPVTAGRPVQSPVKRRRRRVAASCKHASQHEGEGLRAALRAVHRVSAHLPAIA